jgi:ribosomal protein S18 acetylase RimI-like enzyme
VSIDIRPLTLEEVGLVEAQTAFNNPKQHRDRLARQERGDVVYWIAWDAKIPVAHVLVKWSGVALEPMASALPGCPDIENLYVIPDYRQQGIGSGLLNAAEFHTRKRGYRHIGLSVGIDNSIARAMYAGRGYRDAGFDIYTLSGSYLNHDGQTQFWQETCHYFVKSLA